MDVVSAPIGCEATLEWSPDGSSLAMVDGGDRRVSVADVASGEVVWTSDYVGPLGAASAFAVAFSPDGTHLAIAYPVANVITVHNTEQFALVAEIPVPDNIFDLEFTSDGRWLVAGDVQGLVVAIDTTDWAEPAEHRAHRGSAVFHLSSSPSGEQLASLSSDGVVVWNTDDWSVLTSIPLLAAQGVEFIDETHLLVIPIHPSGAYVLTLDPVDLLLAGRQALTRSFTETECATYGIEPCPTLEDIRSR